MVKVMVNSCLTKRINVMTLKMMDQANREPGVEEGVENANGEMKVRGTVDRHQISRSRQTKQRGFPGTLWHAACTKNHRRHRNDQIVPRRST